MFGKEVELKLSNNIVIKVFVLCNPDTTQAQLERRALIQTEYAINARWAEIDKAKDTANA